MKRKQPTEIHETYVIKVDNIQAHYSFGLNPIKDSPEPYWEHSHPTLSGNILRPDLKDVEHATILLMADRIYDEVLSGRKSPAYEPRAVGHLETRDGELRGTISIPFSMIGMVMQSFDAQLYKYIVLRGYKLRYRRALVRSIDLTTTFDPDDY